MKTSVIGFPRVGTLRELKFATEKFFRGEINEDELKLTSGKIRKNQWLLQSSKGIDYIASNDFSFYDNRNPNNDFHNMIRHLSKSGIDPPKCLDITKCCLIIFDSILKYIVRYNHKM